MSDSASRRVVALAPVHDDAAAATRFIAHLQESFLNRGYELAILLVDDGSPTPLQEELRNTSHDPVEVLRLHRNLGHQRAIAIGIAFVQEQRPCDFLLVMDADGEDQPQDAVRLVQQCIANGGQRIVFADRTRRIESIAFQALYRIYQLMHWLLTGIRVRVGNFSVVPARHLSSLVTLPSLWNHYAAAVFQARLPRESIPTARGQRYCGQSKMNLVSLVVHGLQAISVFIDVVAVRLLFFVGGLAALFAILVGVALMSPVDPIVRYSLLALFMIILALGVGVFSLALGLLAQRNRIDFIPVRDYKVFVQGVHPVASTHA